MARPMLDFRVFVFRPNGQRLAVHSQRCTRAEVAVNRTKIKIYQEGRLAHLYT
jgi:hypothetical protein